MLKAGFFKRTKKLIWLVLSEIEGEDYTPLPQI